ncbi:TIGR03617 family F420-dependent LLM class oxidoreductase [Thioalkalivibrio sp. HK1]|uniref:TIGR03617 family F420-dependent LLM class oxidoreductase n=1 Tax=Thioalkalivibrio sp. HK1 TaxID=1469245 RepID=UPI0004B7584E|nr:TIGR03617 family F420-dependent LLM class oxidoreductase [Thioalkalivibrio sp. HK1]
MELDARIPDVPLAEIGSEARYIEWLGFDAIWSVETRHDPFFPLLQAALATERLKIGSNIAVAFARSPFSMAMSAWDLQATSQGRLLLGLGTQVRAHIERRFSGIFDHPAARITDYIDCLRAIWHSFQTGAKPAYEGPFYRFRLISDFFNPGPIPHPDIPVYLAGVNPRMARAAGEVAQGFNMHPMHSPEYLRDILCPAFADGARRRGRTIDDIDVVAMCFVVQGESEAERQESEREVRRQIAFYASTPSYRTFLEFHGEGEAAQRLGALMREGRIDEMADRISDRLLEAVAVSSADGDPGSLLRRRYENTPVKRVSIYGSTPSTDDASSEPAWRELVRSLEEDSAQPA